MTWVQWFASIGTFFCTVPVARDVGSSSWFAGPSPGMDSRLSCFLCSLEFIWRPTPSETRRRRRVLLLCAVTFLSLVSASETTWVIPWSQVIFLSICLIRISRTLLNQLFLKEYRYWVGRRSARGRRCRVRPRDLPLSAPECAHFQAHLAQGLSRTNSAQTMDDAAPIQY